MTLQNCMIFVLLWNIRYILRNIFVHTMKVNGYQNHFVTDNLCSFEKRNGMT